MKKRSEFIWSILQIFLRQGFNVFILFLLSFFLAPAQFGIFSLAMSVFLLLSLMADTGFNAAIIQKQDISQTQLTTVYFLNIAISIGLVFLGVGIALPFSHFYNKPELIPIISILSISLIFLAISSTHTALLQKKLAFKTLTIRDILAVSLGGIVAFVTLLVFNGGAWALVAQSVAVAFISAVSLQYLSTWKPDIKLFDIGSIRELLPYSKHIFGFNVIKYFAQNLDLLFVGYFLGPKAVGLYAFFYKIMIVPFAMLSGAVGNYIFAKYARKEDISMLKRNFLSLLLKQNALLLPLVLLVGTVLTVILDYGLIPLWQEGKHLIPLMGIIVILQITVSPMGNLLKALGYADYLFYWSILLLVEICFGFATLYFLHVISIVNILIVIGFAYFLNSVVMIMMVFSSLKRINLVQNNPMEQ